MGFGNGKYIYVEKNCNTIIGYEIQDVNAIMPYQRKPIHMRQAVNTNQICYGGKKAGKCHTDINLIRLGRVVPAHEIDGNQHNQQNKCYDIIIKDIFHADSFPKDSP